MSEQAEISRKEDDLQLRRVAEAKRPDPENRAEGDEDALDPNGLWSAAAHAATIGIFVLLFFGFLDLARPILVPLTAAFIIGLMLGPVAAFAHERNVPSWVTALVLTGLFVLIVNAVFVLIAAPLVDWVGKAPQIVNAVREKLHVLDRPLAVLSDLRKAVTPPSNDAALKVDTGGPNVVAPVLTFLTPAIGQLLLFVGTLFFFLLGRDEMRRYIVTFFHDRAARLRTLRILNDVEHSLTRYLSVVAVIYFCMGCLTGLIAWIAGLPSPYVWGIVAFVLNFIPYVGPTVVMVVLAGAGLMTFPDLPHAFLAPALYLGIATLEGHFVTPSILGKTLTISPLMVFLALAFWTWMWGPVGALLAVPLLIASLVALSHIRPKNGVSLPG